MTAPTLRPAQELLTLRNALAAAGFTEAELRRRISTPPDHAVNATRYYPEGFPGHDTPLDDLVRLLMIGARVAGDKIRSVLGHAALRTLLDSAIVSRDGSDLCANVTVSLWRDLVVLSDREDVLTSVDYVMPPEAPAVWMTSLVGKYAPAKPERVLDIGTGCGVLALLVAKSAAEVLGADSNARAVEFARFNAAFNAIDNCTFTHARCQDLTASLGARDLVIFNCPGLYELGCLQPEAFSCADGDALLRSLYALLPQLLAPTGVAILRHELPTHAGYLARLIGDAPLRFTQETLPHYAGLTALRTCGVVVTMAR